MNVCSIWPFAQSLDDFYCLDIWQCARYFVAALFKELALIAIREMWGLESWSRSSRSRSRSRLLWQSRSRLEIWTRSRSRRLRSRLHHWLQPIVEKPGLADAFRGRFDAALQSMSVGELPRLHGAHLACLIAAQHISELLHFMFCSVSKSITKSMHWGNPGRMKSIFARYLLYWLPSKSLPL